MSAVYETVLKCYEHIKTRIPFVPRVAVVLGSGLGAFAENMQAEAVIPYSEIDGFPVSTVPGHKGRFVFGKIDGVPIVIMQGRVHYYEGYNVEEVVLPIRLMRQMGAEIAVLTNASGGINRLFKAGDFMLIRDHISSFFPNPLIGENPEELGVRFPDMTEVYNESLCRLIEDTARECKIPLKQGTYVQLTGPSYESPAEIRMLRMLGADAVGMSTVCEAIAARHMGMQVCAISCVTNMAAGILNQPLSHAEVQETADRTAPLFQQLLFASIAKM